MQSHRFLDTIGSVCQLTEIRHGYVAALIREECSKFFKDLLLALRMHGEHQQGIGYSQCSCLETLGDVKLL